MPTLTFKAELEAFDALYFVRDLLESGLDVNALGLNGHWRIHASTPSLLPLGGDPDLDD